MFTYECNVVNMYYRAVDNDDGLIGLVQRQRHGCVESFSWLWFENNCIDDDDDDYADYDDYDDDIHNNDHAGFIAIYSNIHTAIMIL